MRRLALSLVASCGIAALVACSGGYGFSSSNTGGGNVTPDSIVFMSANSQVNDFFVAPDGSAPVQVSAEALKVGTVIPDVVFTWSTTYAPPGTHYAKGGSPNGFGVCGTPSQLPGINSLLQQGPGGNAFPLYYPFYSQLLEQPNSNPPSYTQTASTIYVGPPTIPPAGDPNSDDATLNPVPPAAGSTNYCIYVYAKAVGSGVQGGTIVVVSDSP